MKSIQKIVAKKEIVFTIGMVWGMAIIFVFRDKCIGKTCVRVERPPLKLVHESIYEIETEEGRQCYQMKPSIVECPKEAEEFIRI